MASVVGELHRAASQAVASPARHPGRLFTPPWRLERAYAGSPQTCCSAHLLVGTWLMRIFFMTIYLLIAIGILLDRRWRRVE